jgi:hypothetical protein
MNIADELGWFPAKHSLGPAKQTTLVLYSHEIRKVRNYVRPGVWARDRVNPLRFTKGVHGVVDEVFWRRFGHDRAERGRGIGR